MDWFWQKKPVDLIEQCVADAEAIRPKREELDFLAQLHQHANDTYRAAAGWCAPAEPDYSLADILNANGEAPFKTKSLPALKMESLWE